MNGWRTKENIQIQFSPLTTGRLLAHSRVDSNSIARCANSAFRWVCFGHQSFDRSSPHVKKPSQRHEIEGAARAAREKANASNLARRAAPIHLCARNGFLVCARSLYVLSQLKFESGALTKQEQKPRSLQKTPEQPYQTLRII
jgi:hypothetical protein